MTYISFKSVPSRDIKSSIKRLLKSSIKIFYIPNESIRMRIFHKKKEKNKNIMSLKTFKK